MVCILLCVIQKIYNGTVYTTIILKEKKNLCQHLFLLGVGGNAVHTEPLQHNNNTTTGNCIYTTSNLNIQLHV
jgi:hypothetical protein